MSQPLYFGNELDAFIPSDNGVVEAVTAYNPTYCRCSINVPAGSSAKSVVFSAQTAMWFHMDNYMGAFNSGYVSIWYALDSLGVVQFIIQASKYTPSLTNTSYKILYLSAPATYTQIGATAVTAGGLQTLDLFVDIPNGIAKLNINGSEQISGTASMASMTSFSQVWHLGGRDGYPCNWSQLFGSLEPTVGRRLMTLVEDTNGALQDFAGAVTDINELVLNDATGITAALNGDTSTYYKNGLALTGNILGMGTSARFNVGSGPQNLENALYVSGAPHSSGVPFAGDPAFRIAQYMWMTNPATAGVWSPGTASAVQWGAKAIT